MRVNVTVNGEKRTADDVWPGESLLYVLRERLGLPGSKNACEQGECGSCTVYLDDVPVCACLVAAGQAEGREVRTVEGLADGDDLDPVQRAFLDAGAVQCGFCTPGLIVATHDLLRRVRQPERRGDPRVAGRKPVPLHRLREDHGRRPAGRREDCAHEPHGDHRCRSWPRWTMRAPSTSPVTWCVDGERISDGRRRAPRRRCRTRPSSTPRGCLITPGLVNTHHHLYQWATRGMSQNSTLFEWLVELYPVWGRLDADITHAAASGGLARLALTGCTTVADHHYVFPADGGDLADAVVVGGRPDRHAVAPGARLDGPWRVRGWAAAGQHRRVRRTPRWPAPSRPSRSTTTRPATRGSRSPSARARRSR